MDRRVFSPVLSLLTFAAFLALTVFSASISAQTLTLLDDPPGGPCDPPNPAAPGDVPSVAGGNLARGADAVAFGTPTFAEGSPPSVAHKTRHLNDGLYSNGNSWIGQWCPGTDPANEDADCACPDECVCPGGECPEVTRVYAGIYFTSGTKTVGQIAFGRDATGIGTDRAGGNYEVQYTADEFDFNNHASVESANWISLGSVDVTPLLRHRYGFEENVDARAVRILMTQFWAIDEIEVGEDIFCPTGGPCGESDPPDLQTVELGGPVALDGPATSAAEVPSFAEGNVARALDAVAFATPSFADTAPGTPAGESHKTRHLNDGNYGNGKSWIGVQLGSVTGKNYFGIYFTGGPREITQVAFGRDNLVDGAEDRATGENIIQVTMDEFDHTTDSGVGTASWTCVGITDDAAAVFEFDRRVFDLESPVMVRGVRVLTSVQNGIDEIEIGGSDGISICDPRCLQVVQEGGPVDPPNPAAADDVPGFSDGNFAQASDAVVFATPTFGPAVASHTIPHLTDGLYGNDKSWIGEFCPGTDPEAEEVRDCPGANIFGGVYFSSGARNILDVAIGRDATGGGTDRAAGDITIQTTDDEFDPADDLAADAASWTTQGQFPLKATRQRYQLRSAVSARAVRFLTNQSNAIDEFEVGLFTSAPTGLTLIELGGAVSLPVAAGDVPTDADGNLARKAGAVAFGSPTFPVPSHAIAHLNDGLYGNGNSWIGEFCPGTDPTVMEERECPEADIYAGIYFTEGTEVVGEVAFGRDATGAGTDRAGGVIVVQTTTDEFDPHDASAVASASWADAGDPVAYGALRQRFRFATSVAARAVRIVTAQYQAVDELEVGTKITKFSLELTEVGSPINPGNPAAAPADVPSSEEGNLARDEDSVPFGTPTFDLPPHNIAFLNDGLYGNGNSWIGEFCPDTDPTVAEERDCADSEIFAGIYFTGGTKAVDAIAVGRENLVPSGGADRAGGRITVQVTESEFDPTNNASATATSWSTVGIFNYNSQRQRFQFGETVDARAVRILISQYQAVDEIELYGAGSASPPPDFDLVEIGGPTASSVAPDSVPGADDGNVARAEGAVAFGTPTFDLASHDISHLNDGLYGNSNSWIGEFCPDTDPTVAEERECPDAKIFAGIYFTMGTQTIEEIAFGRDALGEATDRADGTAIVEVTLDEFDPANNSAAEAASWTQMGTTRLTPGRRRYAFDAVEARAVRVVIQQYRTIDEIEVGKISTFSMSLAEVGPNPVAADAVPSLGKGNLALSSNALPFGTPTFDLAAHAIPHLNDGLYGNSNSWIGEFCPDAVVDVADGNRDCPGTAIFAGIYFNGSLQSIGGLAIGRESTVDSADRAAGPITVQYTTDDFDPASNASASAANWTHVGTFNYQSKRQRFVFGQTVNARAVRVLIGQYQAVDELELFGPEGSGTTFRRGDCDQDGAVTFTDSITHLEFLFLGLNESTVLACRDACDTNDSGDDDFTDDINTLEFLFLGTFSIPAPAPLADGTHPCGIDPTEPPEDLRGCEEYNPTTPCP